MSLWGATECLAQASSDQRAACTPDVWRLCASEIPNVPGITACLRRERVNLSPGCRAVLTESERGPRPVASNERRF
ncbi:hypothetical protein [Methylobacterium crusticola]|nr:hypothetical protein [Methylobacterium crusticola]